MKFRWEEEGKAAEGVEEVLRNFILVGRGDYVVAETANKDNVG